MKKCLLIILFTSLACVNLVAKGKCPDYPRITFGAEWSYSATFFSGHHYYFYAPEGFRVDDRSDRLQYLTDGEVYLHCGYNINSRWNLSAYLGYTGIGDFHAGIPMSLRATRYFKENAQKDRWFAFVDLGSGICLKKVPQELITAKAGGGYRLSLSRLTKLDFIGSIRYVHTRPDIDFYGVIIDRESIGTNVGYIMSVSLGLAITF